MVVNGETLPARFAPVVRHNGDGDSELLVGLRPVVGVG